MRESDESCIAVKTGLPASTAGRKSTLRTSLPRRTCSKKQRKKPTLFFEDPDLQKQGCLFFGTALNYLLLTVFHFFPDKRKQSTVLHSELALQQILFAAAGTNVSHTGQMLQRPAVICPAGKILQRAAQRNRLLLTGLQADTAERLQ